MKKLLAMAAMMLPFATEAMDVTTLRGVNSITLCGKNVNGEKPEATVSGEITVKHRFGTLNFMSFYQLFSFPAQRCAAFSCISLEKICIPATVEVLGKHCLSHVDLSEIKFEKGSRLRCIGASAFYGISRLEKIEIPASVEDINEWSFFRCERLSDITFETGSRLHNIRAFAFARTAIYEIIIPANVEILGNDCFVDCFALQESNVKFAEGSPLQQRRENALLSVGFRRISNAPANYSPYYPEQISH
jgi:hypothetical protein